MYKYVALNNVNASFSKFMSWNTVRSFWLWCSYYIMELCSIKGKLSKWCIMTTERQLFYLIQTYHGIFWKAQWIMSHVSFNLRSAEAETPNVLILALCILGIAHHPCHFLSYYFLFIFQPSFLCQFHCVGLAKRHGGWLSLTQLSYFRSLPRVC